MPNIKQNADGTMGIEGTDAGPGILLTASTEWIAASVDKVFYVAQRAMVIQSIIARVEASGTDASAVTAVIKKAPSGTAIASGTALHSSTINLKGTAATNQTLTLSTTDGVIRLAAGDAIGIDFTGTLTSATGTVVIGMNPA